MAASGRARGIGIAVGVALVVAAHLAIGAWPATTAVGYNYHVTVKRLTLFEKMIAFVDRDFEMRRIAREIGGSTGTPEQRLLRMYAWVADNIHPVPPGFPIVDDHVSHIFVRHYGADDQRAEALAALASYSGMPATIVGLAKGPKMRGVQLTLVRLGDRLVVFDVIHRIAFHRRSGELADFDDLKADPSLIADAGVGITIDSVPYHEHFAHLEQVTPRFLRMEEQRFWPRLKHELLSRFGIADRTAHEASPTPRGLKPPRYTERTSPRVPVAALRMSPSNRRSAGTSVPATASTDHVGATFRWPWNSSQLHE